MRASVHAVNTIFLMQLFIPREQHGKIRYVMQGAVGANKILLLFFAKMKSACALGVCIYWSALQEQSGNRMHTRSICMHINLAAREQRSFSARRAPTQSHAAGYIKKS
jgi:hypothetical protein